jgi:putative oxidoreductase
MEVSMRRFFATNDSWVAFAQRAVLAGVILPHGAQKLLGWFGGYGWTGTMGYFESLGMPALLGALVILGESLGAIALLFGAFTRLAATGIAASMVGAVALVHAPNGFFMNWFGAGRWSVDGILARAHAAPLRAKMAV